MQGHIVMPDEINGFILGWDGELILITVCGMWIVLHIDHAVWIDMKSVRDRGGDVAGAAANG